MRAAWLLRCCLRAIRTVLPRRYSTEGAADASRTDGCQVWGSPGTRCASDGTRAGGRRGGCAASRSVWTRDGEGGVDTGAAGTAMGI
ncbi:hypothetical protein C8Q70DRAFT_998768 [Cubamyces menziesii]|nr:hypothetical protein C8Q70DRAFT_998768 [Cubamyces menziesii]